MCNFFLDQSDILKCFDSILSKIGLTVAQFILVTWFCSFNVLFLVIFCSFNVLFRVIFCNFNVLFCLCVFVLKPKAITFCSWQSALSSSNYSKLCHKQGLLAIQVKKLLCSALHFIICKRFTIITERTYYSKLKWSRMYFGLWSYVPHKM